MSSMTHHAGTLCTQSRRCTSVKTTALSYYISVRYTRKSLQLKHREPVGRGDNIVCILLATNQFLIAVKLMQCTALTDRKHAVYCAYFTS